MTSIKQRYKNQTSTPVGKIIFFSLLFLIVAGITGGILYWRANRKSIIRSQLDNTLAKKTKGLYTIKYDDLQLDEVNGDLKVTNLRMEFDSAKFAQLNKDGEAPPILLHIQVPSLSVSGVKTTQALIDKEIVGTRLHINQPLIEINYTMAGKDSVSNVPQREVYEQILGNLNLIKIDTVDISGAIITTQNFKTKKKSLELVNTDIQLIDVAVDSASNADTTRFFFARNIELNCASVEWRSANELYKYRVDSLQTRSADKTIRIKSFEIQPQKGEDAFVKSLPTQDDRFDFSIRNISLSQVDFASALKENIIADTIRIGSANFKIYRDLSIVRDKKNRVGTYPHQSVAKIPIPVEVKKLYLNNTFVEYKEKNAKTKKIGKVQFTQASAVITNLTNKKELVAKNNIMTVDINCRFLNEAPFDVTWSFYLLNPKGRFDVKGNLGAFAAKKVNVISEPMGPARIEDGQIKGLSFNLSGHDYGMNGKVKFLYDDLKIAVLSQDDDTKKFEKKKLASFVANFIVKNSNPSKKDSEAREITVENERDTNRSIFHLAWKTLFKGIKETAGINK